ncbi:MAG: polymer-forming cytoskeletal protein [Verrucomicrobiales bacterium]|nr:polymer-forming cytoskeletal protein [Verrucomicrobiales bacterium]
MSLAQKLFHWRKRVVAPLVKPRFTQLTTGGVSLRGAMHTTAAGYFGCELDGDLSADNEIIIEPGGKIRGNLRGVDFSVEGGIQGDIDADGEVSLKDQSQVRGTVSAKSLLIESGANFSGTLAIGGDERSLALNLKSKA